MKRTLAILMGLILAIALPCCALAEGDAPAPTEEPVQMDMTDEEIAAMVIGRWDSEDVLQANGTYIWDIDTSYTGLLVDPGYFAITSKVYEFTEDGTVRRIVRGRRLIGTFESYDDAKAQAGSCEQGEEETIIDGEVGTYEVKNGQLYQELSESHGTTFHLPYYVICYDDESFVTKLRLGDTIYYDRWIKTK